MCQHTLGHIRKAVCKKLELDSRVYTKMTTGGFLVQDDETMATAYRGELQTSMQGGCTVFLTPEEYKLSPFEHPPFKLYLGSNEASAYQLDVAPYSLTSKLLLYAHLYDVTQSGFVCVIYV